MEYFRDNKAFSALKYLPLELMQRHKIVPFGYDPQRRALRVACTSPNNEALADELSRSAGGIRIELYAANQDAIESVIGRLSVIRPDRTPTPVVSVSSNNGPSQIDPEKSDSIKDGLKSNESFDGLESAKPQRGNILFVAPKVNLNSNLYSALRRERYAIRQTENISAALEYAEAEAFDHIFVHDSYRGQAEKLLEWVHHHAPWISFRFFSSEAAILANDTTDELTFELFQKNLIYDDYKNNDGEDPRRLHAAEVVRWAEELSHKFDLPSHIRLAVMTAAHLHNLAEFFIDADNEYNQDDLVSLSASRLAQWNYPSLIVRLLHCMNQNMSNTPRGASDIERLGGSILTAADLYCHAWPETPIQTREQLEQVRELLKKNADKFVIPEVADHLLEILTARIPAQPPRGSRFIVHILVPGGILPDDFEDVLKNAGFDVTRSDSAGECVRSYTQNRPQVLVIRNRGTMPDIYDLLLDLSSRHAEIRQIPTILLLDDDIVCDAMKLIRHGVEDILPVTADIDALVTKLTRIKNRIEEKSHSRLAVLRELGTHGSLEAMSLMDLLEASRGNTRPAHISVTADGKQLTVCVDQGKIVFAECDDAKGIEAILQGIGWKKGIWSIDPIEPAEIPSSNINEGIDSVLLEACMRYDTASKN